MQNVEYNWSVVIIRMIRIIWICSTLSSFKGNAQNKSSADEDRKFSVIPRKETIYSKIQTYLNL